MLLRGTRALVNGSSRATGGAGWAKSKTFHTEELDTKYEEDVYLTRDGPVGVAKKFNCPGYCDNKMNVKDRRELVHIKVCCVKCLKDNSL